MASVQGLRNIRFYSFFRGGERNIFLEPQYEDFVDEETALNDVELIISDEGFDACLKALLEFEC